MNSIDEVVRVAVVADAARLSGPEARLLEALAGGSLPGFHVDLPDSGVPVGAAHDLVHLLSPLPQIAAVAAEHGIGLIAGYPIAGGDVAISDCRLILSPGQRADAHLLASGASRGQLRRWQPGVDSEAFGPGHYDSAAFPHAPSRITVLSVGIPERPDLLAAAFEAAAALEPRLHLVMTDGEADLSRLYASADLLLHLSHSHAFALDVVEAQASGLPVLAVDSGSARELIEDGRTGVLVPPVPAALAEALVSLSRRATLRERLTVGGLNAVRGRTWERSLRELTAAWSAALVPLHAELMHAA